MRKVKLQSLVEELSIQTFILLHPCFLLFHYYSSSGGASSKVQCMFYFSYCNCYQHLCYGKLGGIKGQAER